MAAPSGFKPYTRNATMATTPAYRVIQSDTIENVGMHIESRAMEHVSALSYLCRVDDAAVVVGTVGIRHRLRRLV